jgi:hypothetical protein
MWRKLVVVAALVAAAAAHAQTKKELVTKLLDLQRPGIEGIARVVAAQAAAPLVQAAGQAIARLPAERRQEVANQVQADVREFFNAVEPELRKKAIEIAPSTMGNVLEERFTEAELKQLIAWFESPLARKYQQAAPELQSGFLQRLVAESRPNVETRLKGLRQTLTRRINPPAPAAPASPASGK